MIRKNLSRRKRIDCIAQSQIRLQREKKKKKIKIDSNGGRGVRLKRRATAILVSFLFVRGLNYALALTSAHVIYAELLRGSLVIFTWRIFLYDTRCVDSTNRSDAAAIAYTVTRKSIASISDKRFNLAANSINDLILFFFFFF